MAKKEERFLADKVGYTRVAASERSGESDAEIDELVSSDSAPSSASIDSRDGPGRVAEVVEDDTSGASPERPPKDSLLQESGAARSSQEESARSSANKASGSAQTSSNSTGSQGKSGSASQPLLDADGEPAHANSSGSESSSSRSGTESQTDTPNTPATPVDTKVSVNKKTDSEDNKKKNADVPTVRFVQRLIANSKSMSGPKAMMYAATAGAFALLLVVCLVVYFGWCWPAQWGTFGECEMIGPLPPLSVKPCGKGRRVRRRGVSHGMCSTTQLEDHVECDLGPCALRDYLLDVNRQNSTLRDKARSRLSSPGSNETLTQ